jgi:hypothetical protein
MGVPSRDSNSGLPYSLSKAFVCQVTRGDSPVVGARVLVDFTVDLINGTRTKLSQEPIPLLDNGYGGESS